MKVLEVLYLFAGMPRRADIGECFLQLIHEFNACPDFGFGVVLHMSEVDFLSGNARHDLLVPANRHFYITRLSSDVDILLTSPPCETHTRVRHSASPGPPPVRDATWPRGLPGLDEAQQLAVDNANVLGDFAIKCLHVAGDNGVLAALEFPEDLGRTAKGIPASWWQDAEMRRLDSKSFVRGAIYQSEWAKVPYLKPTGLITNAATLYSDPQFYQGWPQFDDRKRYLGPLPPRKAAPVSLVGKKPDCSFVTGPTARFPPAMCM